MELAVEIVEELAMELTVELAMELTVELATELAAFRDVGPGIRVSAEVIFLLAAAVKNTLNKP